MRKILAVAVILALVLPVVANVWAEERQVAVVRITGMEEGLVINIAMPSLLDVLSKVTVVVSIQRPDTYEFVDPDQLTVELSFMGFKMAEKTLDELERVSAGVYVAQFKPVGIPLLLDIKVTASWTSPWGETVTGEKKTNVMLNFFYNITGRLKQFFSTFLNSHNITAYLHGLYENFTSTFSKWVEGFKRFATILRLSFGNLFGLKRKAWSKVVVLNATELSLLSTWNQSLETDILSVLAKAKLVPVITVVNSLSEFYNMLYNDSETNVILINLGQYFPIPQTNRSWQEELRNATVLMAKKHWRVVLFSEPFRYLYNGSHLDTNRSGWEEFLRMAGFVLWGDVPQYYVLSNADVAGTTLIDKILGEFNITIPYSARGDIIAVPNTLPADWAYEVVGTSLVAMFRMDAPTGVSLVVGIPTMLWRSLLFGVGMIGWQVHELFARVLDVLKTQISQAIQGLPFYDELQGMVADLENMMSGNYNASAIFNKILEIGKWLSKVLVNPWQMIIGGLGGEFTSAESEIAEENQDIYQSSGAMSDVTISVSDVETQILQHVQALYATTMLDMMNNLPAYVSIAITEAERGHWSGSVNTTEAFIAPQFYEDEMSAEDAIMLANQTISLLRSMVSNGTDNPYLNVTADLLADLENASAILSDILSSLEANLTALVAPATSGSVRTAGWLDDVWKKISSLSDVVSRLQSKLGNVWSRISSLTSKVSALFSKISSIWSYLYRFASNVRKWISNVRSALQKAIAGAVKNVKDWVRNNVYEPLKRFVSGAINGLRNAFYKFKEWIINKVNEVKKWVLDKINYLKTKVAELWGWVESRLIGPLVDAGKEFIAKAKEAILSFVDWIRSGLSWLWDRIRDVAGRIADFFRNLPDFIINALREYGAMFLRVIWKVTKASMTYVFERVLSAFGINYNKFVGALRAIWNAIFKVVDFVKSALTAIPKMFSSFAGRLREMINTIIGFIRSAFENASQLIGDLFSRFSNITKVFSTFAGFLGQAKAFVERLTNITTWISVVKYALDSLKTKTKEMTRILTSTAKDALSLGNAYKGESVRIVAQRGSVVYFTYEKDGELVRDVPLKVTVATNEKVYGFAIATEVAPSLYAVDLKDVGAEPDKEYFFFVEKYEVTTSQAGSETEPPTATSAVIYYKEVKPMEGKVAGYLEVEYPNTLLADKENPLRITVVNEKNVYRDVELVVTLVKNKVPIAHYSEVVRVVPGNNTWTVAFGPFYFATPGKATLRVELHQGGTTVLEAEVELRLGLANYLMLAGIGMFASAIGYALFEVARIRRRLG